jgi:hypothetical protein
MAKYSFRALAEDVLKANEKPMGADEIWAFALENNMAGRVGSSGKTPARSIQAQIYMEIKNNGASSVFVQAQRRPVLFALREWASDLPSLADDYTVADLIHDVLSDSDEPLSADEIFDLARSRGLDKRLTVANVLRKPTLSTQLNALSRNVDSDVEKVSSSPATFALSDPQTMSSPSQQVAKETTTATPPRKMTRNERDLHALLTTFVAGDGRFKCRTKTIRQETSTHGRRGSDQWSHPDLVGIYFPFDDYDGETVRLIDTMRDNPYKVFSFEMKWELDTATLRAKYFQAVSNSSWANEGYIVVPVISEDAAFLDDLSRLVNAFGIGVIRLDVQNIEQSEIMFPARTRERLDWATVDRLVSMNKDFRSFVKDVHDIASIGRVWDSFDKPLTPDEYDDYVRSTSVSLLIDRD